MLKVPAYSKSVPVVSNKCPCQFPAESNTELVDWHDHEAIKKEQARTGEGEQGTAIVKVRIFIFLMNLGNRLLRIRMTRVKWVKSTHVSEQRTRAACGRTTSKF